MEKYFVLNSHGVEVHSAPTLLAAIQWGKDYLSGWYGHCWSVLKKKDGKGVIEWDGR